ncbi:MAG: 50S ribosomal protein L5 [Candidatus Riflebacteria bacterium]|nr:50S ribosomal protein L5 [Candidatus Riflebacteria bacterium]
MADDTTEKTEKKEEKKEKKEKKPADQGKAAKPAGKPGKQGKGGKPDREAEEDATPAAPPPPSRLLLFYKNEIVPRLRAKFDYRNPMEVPRITKIVVNVGVGDARDNQKLLEKAVEELRDITGQKPVVTKARQSISNFKIRKGMNIGCFVTLRGPKMWAFLDKLISVSLPRVRDFRGVSPKAFDGRGNYNLGVREQLIFSEINPDKVEKVRGMNITIATSAKNDVEARELLAEFGMPFRK